jgi:DNA-binding NarL/FixJ family response regulator
MPELTHQLFKRALIVEDLEEPREWLAELLPKALPAVKQVDTAATLAQARTCMAQHAYGLALMDWGLPDGTSENLIRDMVTARPGAVVIVTTIHDDDLHVFPALRAGATGYILKSQPTAMVMAQLQGIERGEPALSPSVAARILRHFHGQTSGNLSPDSSQTEEVSTPLTEREISVLRLLAKGYKSSEIAGLLTLSQHTVTSYIRDIYRKLGISSRAEATIEATRRGLVA